MPSLHTHLDTRSRSGRGAHPSLWLGVIVNVTATTVWVRVPTLAQDDIAATNTIAGELLPGDRVVVGLMEGRVDNLVVLAKETPTVAAHIHAETDVRYPGWAALTLTNGWTPGPDAGTYQGLRYRVDSRNVQLHGQIAAGATGEVATLPVTLAHDSFVPAMNPSGTWRRLRVARSGLITAPIAETVYVNAVVPLT